MTTATDNLARCAISALALAVLLLASMAGAQPAVPSKMVEIAGGVVQPLFPIEGEEETVVQPFRIDAVPVTNADFLAFVAEHPEWQRSQIPSVFAGSSYLAGWEDDLALGQLNPQAPVTNVSWFAAAAYCEEQGGRLPTEAEWEFVANAGFYGQDGRSEDGYNERVLSLTVNRSQQPGAVGQGPANYFGVYDMHGLVWEWVFDIGSSFNTGDSRSEGDRRLQLVCGGGSSGATDKSDYAAFLRYAFRSGLDGGYSSGGLGFRCASQGGSR